ncbi:MAG: SurA N-terminal domain-containing protein [Bacteroidales bacterium]|nr:SurA N-terminal domain-containing protein [Bacteroidales bacterium]
MAVLQNIRVKFGVVISVIIALALLSFIIDPSTLESAINSMSAKYDVGNIDGKKISYTDFQADIDRYTTINEMLTGSSVQNEQTQTQIRDAAWQELLDKHLFIKNAKAAGISVGEAEMLDLTTGNNVSPMIASNPAFADENGNFSVDNLVNFIQQIDSDNSGQLRIYWNYLQNAIYTQEFYAKYAALFSGSNYQNALQLDDAVVSGNTTANIDYVMASYPMANDSTISVSSKEIKDYYNSHKDFFKQNASRDMEYVVYEVVPSEKDIQETAETMDKAYSEFAEASNMKTFLLKNSERSLSEYWYKDGELSTISQELNDAVFAGNDITPVIRKGNSFFAGKVMDSKMISDSVYVKHILLQGDGAKALADSLAGVAAKGGSFSNLAAQYSVDQNSATDGEIGNIGWMTQTYMIPGFESVITAEVGKPYVINSQYGSHVVVVSKKTAPVVKKQVAILEKTALASKETFNNFYSQANTFATIAGGTYEGYRKALDSTKVYSHSMNITEATSTYGTIDQAKEVTRWIFDNKAGKASNIITVNNNYFFIAAVKAVHKEGYKPVNEVSSSISQKLTSDKLMAKTKAEVAEKIKGLTTLEQVAEALNSTVTNQTAVSFSTAGYFGAVEPAVLGAASVAKEGEICGPVDGIMGVYVFKVSDRKAGSFYTEDDARMAASQKVQYASQMILPVMMQNADVKDNRARFF